MKKTLLLISTSVIILIWACNGGVHSVPEDASSSTAAGTSAGSATTGSADEAKGFGKFTHINLPATIDNAMSTQGEKIYDLKCASCHRLDGTRLVGPGWKDITKRREPEWIMNFVTNTDENLDKNATAMSLLEECMVRMPNQNLSDADARHVLEFMRSNDAK